MKNYNDLSEITDVNELCRATVESYLNFNNELFDIALVEKNDEAKWKNENLIFDEFVHGVMQITNTKPMDESSISKSFIVKVLLPYTNVNGKSLVDIGYSHLENALLSLNRKQVTIDDERRMIFNEILLSDNGKTSKPINGIEYEIYSMSFNVVITHTLMKGDSQYVEIKLGDTYTKLAGVFSITEETSATFEGGVPTSGVQKNYCASLQTSISVDFFVYKNSSLHLNLFTNKKSKTNYYVKYYDGLMTNSYTMRIAKLIKTGTVGDVIKAHLVLIEKG